MDGRLETPSLVFGAFLHFEDAHWKAGLWPWLVVRQLSGRHRRSGERKALVQFASIWSAREAAVGPRVQDGWGPGHVSPDFTPSIDVADQLYLCLGLGKKS